MAYAKLAGMPEIYGLYGGLVPLILYALFGTSRQMSVGPVAISSVLIAEGISRIEGVIAFSPQFIAYAVAAGLCIGVLQFVFGLLRMGFLVNFLSHPVIAGFTSAAAFIIFASQLSDFLGFYIDRELSLFGKIKYALTNLDKANLYAVGICLGSMALMLFLKKVNRIIPGALIVVVLGIAVSYLFNLHDAHGLQIIGLIPEGLPDFALPDLSPSVLEVIYPTVLTVTIIGIVEGIGIAKTLEGKHQSYLVNNNRELIALGLSKIGGALFLSVPTSGSFTRSAVNNEAGARTALASLVTAAIIGLTLLFFTPIFYYLPKAVLAAVILLAVRGLFEYKEAINLWKNHRSDFFLMSATFLVTLFFGIEKGVLAGVILSVMNVLYRSSRPHIAVLGIVPGKTYYRNVKRFEEIKHETDALIVRFDSQLYFANASYFRDRIRKIVLEEDRPLKCFFLDAKSISDIDSSGLRALRDIHRFLQKKGIDLFVCGAIGTIRDRLEREGFTRELGENRWFLSLHDGVRYYKQTIEKTHE